ncbi:helix-turn-helix transcriptional regulator [Rubinisphaera margarita]|uniref:helix-turn-helix transcriptional regulator n=1 Tax=Rubinisphaera margarita TaxID=2909586 RepID=UPI001EE97241|nr:transcriptional regulator [Rubinisphaera margarita]MCG6157251.1 transcriptional regulator [Rubinisphaera margarita]
MTTAKLKRQWLILRTLAARRFGVTVKELAEELETGLKTIRRDLVDLREAGFPLAERDGPHGRKYWTCEKAKDVPELGFDYTEILSLYLARQQLEPLVGTLIWAGAHSAMKKIKATLKNSQCEYLDKIGGLVHSVRSRTSDYAEKEQILDDLMVTCEDSTIAGISYQSARSTEPVSYFVHPYGFVYFRDSIYLVAFSQHHREVRHFKLDRVLDVERQSLRFERPADFDLDSFHAHTFGVFHEDGPSRRVVIRFDASVRQYVQEHEFHRSQSVETHRDGSLTATFALASLQELKSWVLSFGPKAEVLEPAELREEITHDLKRCLAVYHEHEKQEHR